MSQITNDLLNLDQMVVEKARYLDRKLTELQSGIDAIVTGFTPEPNIAALGATTDLSASSATLSTSNTYTDAAVKASIDSAVDALAAKVELRLDDIEAKVDAILAALINVGVVNN